jgi:hypothetical protein
LVVLKERAKDFKINLKEIVEYWKELSNSKIEISKETLIIG